MAGSVARPSPAATALTLRVNLPWVHRIDRPSTRQAPNPPGDGGYARLPQVRAGVSLGEDDCRIRRNHGVFALLRRSALNLMRHNGETNIRQALYDNAMDLDRLLNYRGIKLH